MALISKEAEDLIVAEEVSSQKTYEARYRRPEWPGGRSGVTIGIGYDVGAGVRDAAQLRHDWAGKIPDAMIEALVPCIGVTGEAAHALLAQVRGRVDVPWSAAIGVFEDVDVPRWHGICAGALPNFGELSLDCKGALVSLAYNRGASFDHAGDRYSEMRSIKAHMIARRFYRIPAEFRGMKRLWPNPSERGLPLRREHEARLFEHGLAASAPAIAPVVPPPKPAEPVPPSPPPAAAPVAKPAAPVAAEHGTAGGVAAATAAVAGNAAHSGMSPGRIVAIVVVGLVLAAIAFVLVRALKRGSL